MEALEIKTLANNLIEEHGLTGWTFSFDRAKKRVGCCKYGKKQITLSKFYAEILSDEEVKDTLLHEIAHAIAGFDAGHGWEWKLVASKIGARPERCADVNPNDLKVKFKYTNVCPSCGPIGNSQRKWSRRKACAKCCIEHNNSTFTPKFLLKQVPNY